MTPDEIIAAVRAELGDPSSGAVAEAMPAIESAIRGCFTPAKETRVIKAAETR